MKIVAKNPKTGVSKVIFDPNVHFERFHFGTKEILPADLAEREKIIRKIINSEYRSRNDTGKKSLNSKEEENNKVALYMDIARQLDIAKQLGRIQQYEVSNAIISRGGSHNDGDCVKYVAIYIDGNLILEPLGQANNMTYVASDFEKVKAENRSIKEKYAGLDSYLSKNGRKKSLADGVIYGIMHTKNDKYDGYNYEEGDILHIIFMLTRDKETFNKSLKEVRKEYGYSGVKRLFSVYTAVKKKSEYPDITREEILAEGEKSKRNSKQIKTTRDNGGEPEI